MRTELGAEADFVENAFSWVWPEGTRHMVELKPNETLAVTPAEIENRWRAKFGEIAGVKEIKFFSKQRMGGETDIGFRMVGKNPQMLQQAAEELADACVAWRAFMRFPAPITRGLSGAKARERIRRTYWANAKRPRKAGKRSPLGQRLKDFSAAMTRSG